MIKGYTTVEKIENYLLTEIDASFESQIERWIEAVEKYIDTFTGRNFIADTVASIRIYEGDMTDSLLIDDCIQITKLEIDDEEIDSDDYFIYPPNNLPKKKIVLDASLFPCGNQNINVTAKWGYSATVPADIEFVATVLMAGLINASRQEGTAQSEAIGAYSISYSTEQQKSDFDKVDNILKSYIKYNF